MLSSTDLALRHKYRATAHLEIREKSPENIVDQKVREKPGEFNEKLS